MCRMKTVKRKTVGVFLIMLMLSNSSLALEIITHDGHLHDTEASAVAAHEVAAHIGMPDTSQTLAAMPAMDHADETCVCDDICCISLIEFVSASSDAIHLRMADSNLVRHDFYQSIALNTLLHPPTA